MFKRSDHLLVIIAIAFTLVLGADAQAAPASHPAGLCKAGTAGFGVGQAGIFVTYPISWPIGTKYSVVVQPTNTAGYSPTSVCTYFNVLKKTDTKFEVQHKRCDNGLPLTLDTAVSLDWIACPHQ